MVDTYSLTTNSDGSAMLTVTFDITGLTCDPSLALNYTPFVLAAKDGAWTLADAQTALAAEINAARSAFDAAAPNFVPPAPIVPEQGQ
jgi:hypothetical protein